MFYLSTNYASCFFTSFTFLSYLLVASLHCCFFIYSDIMMFCLGNRLCFFCITACTNSGLLTLSCTCGFFCSFPFPPCMAGCANRFSYVCRVPTHGTLHCFLTVGGTSCLYCYTPFIIMSSCVIFLLHLLTFFTFIRSCTRFFAGCFRFFFYFPIMISCRNCFYCHGFSANATNSSFFSICSTGSFFCYRCCCFIYPMFPLTRSCHQA